MIKFPLVDFEMMIDKEDHELFMVAKVRFLSGNRCEIPCPDPAKCCQIGSSSCNDCRHNCCYDYMSLTIKCKNPVWTEIARVQAEKNYSE